MDDDDPARDAFATGDPWKPSSYFSDPTDYESTLFSRLELDISSIKIDNPYAPKKPLEIELQLPDLETFEFGPLPELESLEQSSASLGTDTEDTEDDIWKIASDEGPVNKDVVFFTWEAFDNADHLEPCSSYISEAGPKAFDAALKQQERNDGGPSAGKVVKENILFSSLLNLALGRSSILFSFDPKKRTFVQAIQDERPSGLSPTTAQSYIKQFIGTGNIFLWLRAFVEKTFVSPKSIPARVALATAISAILSTFEDHLGEKAREVESFLQLQRLFEKPRTILHHLARMVDAVKSASTNEQLSSILFNRIQTIEEDDQDFLRLSQQILCFVARSSLELLSEWIGMREDIGTVPVEERNSFVTVENDGANQAPIEYAYNEEMMPRYISEEDGRTIFETGNSLRFLKTHHPEHPLASLNKVGVQAPELEWKFGWEDIRTITTKAKEYEENLRNAIRDFSRASPHHARPGPPSRSDDDLGQSSEPDFEKYIEDTKRAFDAPPQDNSRVLPDELYELLDRMLSNNHETPTDPRFSPPLSITPMLSFGPILSAQAALVNAVTLRLFFRSHQLRLHLSIQRQYHLLGDGVFSSRLASALFDPDRETAERRKGTMRSGIQMGLQLGTRSSWPPASSELRLALMGVLSESYHSSSLYLSSLTKGSIDQSGETQARRDTEELPGQLNFAIRQLSEKEMERIMDPDSLYALDFLRLMYVPPEPLHLVISTASLEKYDYIFRFLIRLLRMVFVVSHLPRRYSDVESRRFRNEAHHFVSAVSSYVFYTGIAESWQHFETFIDAMETQIQEEDDSGAIGKAVRKGVDAVKAAHEDCLDGILFSLLLRRRQRRVMALLEEIFDLVLLFAKGCRGGVTKGGGVEMEEEVTDLYGRFKGKVRVFISVCRGLVGKRGYGRGGGSAEENRLERLLVLLEMNGYFAG